MLNWKWASGDSSGPKPVQVKQTLQRRGRLCPRLPGKDWAQRLTYLTNRSHIVTQTLTDCAAVRQNAAAGSVYIEVNAIPQTLCCEKVILGVGWGASPQVAGFCGFCGLNTPIVAFLIFSTVWLECVIYLFSPSHRVSKRKEESSPGFCIFFFSPHKQMQQIQTGTKWKWDAALCCLNPDSNSAPWDKLISCGCGSWQRRWAQGSCPCTATTGIKGKGEREGSDNNGKLLWHPDLSNYWI